jgi:hypothetical protein
MIHVYITSRYGDRNDTATRMENVEFSMNAWHRLADAGFAPFSPLLSHFLHEHSPRPRSHWLYHSLLWVDRCDCLVALGAISEGMRAEIERAHASGKPVFYSLEDLGTAHRMEI